MFPEFTQVGLYWGAYTQREGEVLYLGFGMLIGLHNWVVYIWGSLYMGGHINKILRYVKNGDRFNAYLHFHEATNLASEVTGKRK